MQKLIKLTGRKNSLEAIGQFVLAQNFTNVEEAEKARQEIERSDKMNKFFGARPPKKSESAKKIGKLKNVTGRRLSVDAIQDFIMAQNQQQAVQNGKLIEQSDKLKNIYGERPPAPLVINNEMLLKTEDTSHGGYQFGNPVDVHITPENAGHVFDVGMASLWVVRIVSEGAHSLSVIFDKYRLPEGAELHAYTKVNVLGAFTAKNNKAHGYMSIFPLEGSEITLELYVPRSKASEVAISIEKVTHGYKKKAFGSSGICNNNVICPEGDAWRAQIRGAAMMLTQFGSRYCSGSMINNINSDGRQLYLTAAHCVGGNIYSDMLMFNYQSSVCPVESQVDGPTSNTVSGLQNLAQYVVSDFSLFEVEEEIPDSYSVYLNGFSAENVPAEMMVGIHHPSGDIKKISFANKTAIAARWSSDPFLHWEVEFWDDGTTEPGSSGSPLFDQNKRIVGQLHGGLASCTRIDYDQYGAVWASFDYSTIAAQQMKPHLDPRNTGIRVWDGVDLNVARARKAGNAKLDN